MARSVEDALFDRIAEDGAIMSRIGNHLYRGWVPTTPTTPTVTFMRTSRVPVNHVSGAADYSELNIEMEIWAPGCAEAQEIADLITARLTGWNQDSDPPVNMTWLVSEACGVESADTGENAVVYHITHQYTIHATV